MIKAIVFDFDGVILESLDIKTQAFLELFKDYPQHQAAIRQLHLENAGISRDVKFKRIYRELLHQPLSQVEAQQLSQAFRAIVFRRILTCPLVPGAEPFLQTQAARLPLFIASGTPQTELVDILEQRGLAPLFTRVWGSPTPKREALAQISQAYHLAPWQMVMIGDAASDFEAAATLGVPFIGRVPAGAPCPFPVGSTIVRDLAELNQRWPQLQQQLAANIF